MAAYMSLLSLSTCLEVEICLTKRTLTATLRSLEARMFCKWIPGAGRLRENVNLKSTWRNARDGLAILDVFIGHGSISYSTRFLVVI